MFVFPTMWNHIKGVSKPEEKKHKLSDDEQKDRGREYDHTKRQRKYDSKWEKTFPWLTLDQESQDMICRPCRSFPALSDCDCAFVKGTSNFKIDSIRKHAVSAKHIRAHGAEKAVQIKPGESKAEKIIFDLNKQQIDRLRHLFRTCHALAKNSRPFTDYVWICQLDSQKGIDLGNTYLNDKAAQIFTHYIAKVQRLKLKANLDSALFIAPMMDGSTDKSVSEQEIVYLRFAKKGVMKEQFISLEPVEKADAEGLLRALDRAMTTSAEQKHWKQKLVAIATDGASVNTGKKSGLVKRLRDDVPHLVGIHCMAHRLELALNDAAKQVNPQKVINQLLLSLYLFYHFSPLNRANLKASYTSLGMEFLVSTRVGGTRWAAHTLRALNHLIRGYPALVQHLQQISGGNLTGVSSDAKNKAIGYLKLLQSRNYLMYIHFLADVLADIRTLSELLQKRGISLSDANDCLHATKDVLLTYKSRSGVLLRKLEASGDAYNDVPLKAGGPSFEPARQQLLDHLITALTNRFAEVSNDGVIRATALLNLQSWPEKGSSDGVEFGVDDITLLTDHFSDILETAGVGTEAPQQEWALLKAQIYRQPKWQELSWARINGLFTATCPNILHLMDLLLTIPVATAECERGFSTMKLTKTDHRSRLKSDVLTDLMRIQFVSPDIADFSPEEAIQLWHNDSQQARRPDYKDNEVIESDNELCSDGELSFSDLEEQDVDAPPPDCCLSDLF